MANEHPRHLDVETIDELITESEKALLRAKLYAHNAWADAYRARLRSLATLRMRAEARESKPTHTGES